jgi:hypothetical protein
MKSNELTLEQIKTLFFDKNSIVEPAYKIYRVGSSQPNDIRYYYELGDDGKPIFYLNSTSVSYLTSPTPEQLKEWQMNKGKQESAKDAMIAAKYGTLMHMEIPDLLIAEKYNLEGIAGLTTDYLAVNRLENEGLNDVWAYELKNDMLAFAQFIIDYDVRPIACEIILRSKNLKIASPIDAVVEMNDKLYTDKTPKEKRGRIKAIIDWKSGRKGFYRSSEIQLHIYFLIWKENYPDIKIDKVLNWSPKEWTVEPTYNLKDQTESKEKDRLQWRIPLALSLAFERTRNVIITGGEIDLKKGILDNFEVMTYDEFIELNNKT